MSTALTTVVTSGGAVIESRESVTGIITAGSIGPPGPQGPPGPPGESNIAGFGISMTGVTNGDLIMFDGTAWTNEHKTVISDGGNF